MSFGLHDEFTRCGNVHRIRFGPLQTMQLCATCCSFVFRKTAFPVAMQLWKTLVPVIVKPILWKLLGSELPVTLISAELLLG